MRIDRREISAKRAALRVELDKMENAAEIEINLDSFRELELLAGCCLTSLVSLGRQGKPRIASEVVRGSRFLNQLENVGLHVKDDCYDDDKGDMIGEEQCTEGSSDDKTLSSVVTEGPDFCNPRKEFGKAMLMMVGSSREEEVI